MSSSSCKACSSVWTSDTLDGMNRGIRLSNCMECDANLDDEHDVRAGAMAGCADCSTRVRRANIRARREAPAPGVIDADVRVLDMD